MDKATAKLLAQETVELTLDWDDEYLTPSQGSGPENG